MKQINEAVMKSHRAMPIAEYARMETDMENIVDQPARLMEVRTHARTGPNSRVDLRGMV